MTPHLEAAAGDFAEVVLLPGDPDRAAFIAKTMLDDPRCVNRIRGALGFTGSFRGVRVSVQTTGMGPGSLAIYAHELISFYGVRTLLRVGSCGSLTREVGLRSAPSGSDQRSTSDREQRHRPTKRSGGAASRSSGQSH